MLAAFLFDNRLKLLQLTNDLPNGPSPHENLHLRLFLVSRSSGGGEEVDDGAFTMRGRSSHVISTSSASVDQFDELRPTQHLMLAICICRSRKVMVILEACAKMFPS